jgi:hypothetical protein
VRRLAEVLCLQDRFRVTVDWNNPHPAGGFGTGTGAAFDGDQSGTFWFFDPSNVELIVKVLDATTLNDHFWVFHGALTDVEYWISVLDTETGRSQDLLQPAVRPLRRVRHHGIPGEELPAARADRRRCSPTGCAPRVRTPASCGDDDTLCLLGGRFEVEVDWVGRAGRHRDRRRPPVTGSDQTGYFWFFDQSNIELVSR